MSQVDPPCGSRAEKKPCKSLTYKAFEFWWRFRDLNPGPADYDSGRPESRELSDASRRNASAGFRVSECFGLCWLALAFCGAVSRQCPAASVISAWWSWHCCPSRTLPQFVPVAVSAPNLFQPLFVPVAALCPLPDDPIDDTGKVAADKRAG